MVAAVAVSFLALSSSVAGADQLKDDTNGLVAGDQDGVVNKTLAAGASGSVNIGAWVNDAGRAVTVPHRGVDRGKPGQQRHRLRLL
jgi:hypothetical protein